MLLPDYDQPYRFYPAYRSKRYCRMFTWTLAPGLRLGFKVARVKCQGVDHLRASLAQDAGVILAASHCRYADPPVLGMLSLEVGRFFYYAASWHLFQTSRLARFRMNRFGAFSVYREGADRDAIKESIDLLADADRPIVIFPEGTFYRQNDRIGPLLDGIAFIAKQAARKGKRPCVVHPVAIKYYFLEDPRPMIDRRLARLENAFEWSLHRTGDFRARLDRLTQAYVALKEIDVLGAPSQGPLPDRMVKLADTLLTRVEESRRPAEKATTIIDRVRVARPLAVKAFRDAPAGSREKEALRREIYDLALAQQIFAHLPDYLDEWPCEERIAEALQRFEEDVLHKEWPVAMSGAIIDVGPAIKPDEAPPGRRSKSELDPITTLIGERLQRQMDNVVAAGPPPEWNYPLPPTPRAAAQKTVVVEDIVAPTTRKLSESAV